MDWCSFDCPISVYTVYIGSKGIYLWSVDKYTRGWMCPEVCNQPLFFSWSHRFGTVTIGGDVGKRIKLWDQGRLEQDDNVVRNETFQDQWIGEGQVGTGRLRNGTLEDWNFASLIKSFLLKLTDCHYIVNNEEEQLYIITIGDLSRHWLFYLGPLVFLLPKILKLFGFLIFRPWAYLMKVILEMRPVH